MRVTEAEYAKLQNRNTNRPANVESAAKVKPLAADENTPPDTRYNLHIHSVRKRLCDLDGISSKAAIDGIVKAGILPDDSAQYIKQITYTQEKGSPERTEISFEVIQ
jgi:hypothetical protein